MVDKAQAPDVKVPADESAVPPPPAAAAAPPAPPRRGPGHRGADVRDTVAEMAARAQEISQEAGSKMASALKDVINAAAGLSTFAVESARDLVQYMVRRGQMTQEEADKLIREAEQAHVKRGGSVPPPAAKTETAVKKPAVPAVASPPAPPAPASSHSAPKAAIASAPAAAPPAARKSTAVPASKSAAKAPARPSSGSAKPAAKGSGKSAAKKAPPKKR
ncbi:MAG TPA: hypothetical protein VKA84_09755 [Gemmatimonadaceae bacterium]|nr:hypothetical protein [Gemmatimonadaceae bacterium]